MAMFFDGKKWNIKYEYNDLRENIAGTTNEIKEIIDKRLIPTYWLDSGVMKAVKDLQTANRNLRAIIKRKMKDTPK